MGTKLIKDSSALGQFGSAIAQICEEKGIEKKKVIESVEAALAAAYKKDYGHKGQIIIAHLGEDTGEVSFKQLREVIDESVRVIEREYLTENAHEIGEGAKKSDEILDGVKVQEIIEESETLPRFNPERDVLLEDAVKIDNSIAIGEFIEIPLETKDQYGRVASQTAKQVIIQRIREAERDSMFEEYKEKEGDVVNGTVQRVELNKVFIDLGKAVGVLFPSEQIPTERYRIGQRIKVYLSRVESDPKGPGITLSRRHPELLKKLFELEVPEIFAGTVEIKAIAREAGGRSKIAVISNEDGIDPIGSCVGQKGTRVQAVIDEICGEKIDIIEWSEDPEEMIASALSPAKVINVEAKESEKKEEGETEERKAIAYVTQEQLSLAIGKRGQNVRLAAKLTGWKIDVEVINDDSEATTTDSEEKKEIVETEKEDSAVEDKKKSLKAEEIEEGPKEIKKKATKKVTKKKVVKVEKKVTKKE
ncbi:transcription termination/antitermination protein NusA [bacterium]|jgi:transcription termination/antitermination protein NusA|nr:transcription termination/antitermination protein NusA [bacterium]MBT4251497.1 transcription termination/antitermination protein NusA [bacterium]MBT4597471.1 transcription termination/antitermination protein NusA [bacterium]MBT6754310.1 transcription termination/antitermination protein NusA [bacterium]MBT7037636.1 transcription termination/antitermination protein NusA [bacterium]